MNQLERLCSFLLHENSKFNLTGAQSAQAVVKTLFLDSLSVLPALPAEYLERRIYMADVGSGAGFPGLPLKIAFPHWSLVCIESTGKKAAFIRQAATELRLENVTVVAERAEVAGADGKWRERAELCLARAVASLPTLVELCAPLVKVGGLMAFPKSGSIENELTSAAPALKALRSALVSVVPVPEEIGLGSGRVSVICKKVGTTPRNFPRRIGLAKSQPIAR